MSSPEVSGVNGSRPEAVPALSVRALTKRYGSTVAVDDVSFEVADGQFLALVGPSGCGKSTLLRLIAGLLEPQEGVITIAGREVTGRNTSVPAQQRDIGIVFQEPALFPHLDVAENVAFGLGGRSKSERRARVRGVLELVDLIGYEGRYPHELSGGERQRVALARSLAPAPAVMLLDEPFANLDHNLRVEVRAHTKEILERAGATVVFVTHDQQEALALGDRLAVMRAGRLLQTGTPEAVFHHPANTFVATFLGDADFLPARVNGDGTLHTEAGVCSAPDTPIGDDIEVMVRPHEVRLTAAANGTARVVGGEFQGGFILYEVEMASGRRLRSLQPHTVKLEPGSRVEAMLDHGHVPALLSHGRAVTTPSRQ